MQQFPQQHSHQHGNQAKLGATAYHFSVRRTKGDLRMRGVLGAALVWALQRLAHLCIPHVRLAQVTSPARLELTRVGSSALVCLHGHGDRMGLSWAGCRAGTRRALRASLFICQLAPKSASRGAASDRDAAGAPCTLCSQLSGGVAAGSAAAAGRAAGAGGLGPWSFPGTGRRGFRAR